MRDYCCSCPEPLRSGQGRTTHVAVGIRDEHHLDLDLGVALGGCSRIDSVHPDTRTSAPAQLQHRRTSCTKRGDVCRIRLPGLPDSAMSLDPVAVCGAEWTRGSW